MTDGLSATSDYLHPSFTYLVVELKQIIEDPVVRLYGSNDLPVYNFEVRIGRSFLPCRRERLDKLPVCATVQSDAKDAPCKGSAGFVALKIQNNGYLYITELHILSADKNVRHVALQEFDKTCESTDGPAKTKHVYSDTDASAAQLVDGDVGKCASSKYGSDHYFVIDLKEVHDIQNVRLWSRFWEGNMNRNLTISLGYEFRSCFKEDLSRFRTCYQSTSDIAFSAFDTKCYGTGRYIAIRQNIFSNTYFTLCEVDVFGKKVSPDNWRDTCSNLGKQSVVFNKPVYVKGDTDTTHKGFVDGKIGKSYKVPSTIEPWLVIDTKSTTYFDIIRIFNMRGTAVSAGVDVLIGANWRRCQPELLDDFEKCHTIPSERHFNEVKCPLYEGQYIALRARGNGTFSADEIEVLSHFKPKPITERSGKDICKFQRNLATGKKVMGNVHYGKASYLTDGVKTSCAKTRTPNGWLTIDLGKVYKIDHVSFSLYYKWWRKPTKDMEIKILTYFNPCRPDLVHHGVHCNPVKDGISIIPYAVDCSAYGQFVAIRSTGGEDQSLHLCEIQVFGTLMKDMIPVTVPPPPVIENPLPTGDSFPIFKVRETLLKEVNMVPVYAHSTVVNVLGGNATCLFNKRKSYECIVAVSEFGKSRVIVAGHDAVLQSINTATDGIWFKIKEWLAKDNEPVIKPAHDVTTYSSSNAPGTIILWSAKASSVSERTKDVILRLLTDGHASVVIGDKGSQLDNTIFPPYLDVLAEAGISMSRQRIVTANTDWGTKGFETFDIISLANKLDYVSASTDYFLKRLPKLLDIVDEVPSQYLEKMNIMEKLSMTADLYESYINAITPCIERPVSIQKQKDFIDVFSSLLMSRGLSGSGRQATSADLFPGFPKGEVNMLTVSIKFVGTSAHEAHSTGLYAMPGVTFGIRETGTPSGDIDAWYVRVGCHTDDLIPRPEWYRPRRVSSKPTPVMAGNGYNGYGGIIWVINRKPNTNITLEFKDVFRAPYFNIRDENSVKNWNSLGRYHPAPWAEIAGDSIVFCVDSAGVRNLSSDYLKHLMTQIWDLDVKGNFWLALGNWKDQRRERFTLDIQTALGSGHSGYPMVAFLYWNHSLLDESYIDKHGAWGPTHELGHNLQRSSWTFEGTTEVTNNIFSVFGMYLWGKDYYKILHNEGRLTADRNHLDAGAPYTGWLGDVRLALEVYMQTAYHLGWEVIQAVFLKYRREKIKPNTIPEQRDTWVKLVSEASERNLCPMYEFWGFTVSESLKTNLSKLYTAFLPDDLLTQLSPRRTSEIVAKYPGVSRSSELKGMNGAFRDKIRAFTHEILPNDVREL